MAIHYPELDQEGPTPAQERDHLAEQCTTLLRENERLRAALLVAKLEIDWWVDEHRCCNGHQDEAIATIESALGHQQQPKED